MIAAILNLLLGTWITAAPDVLEIREPLRWVYHVIGPLVASFGVIAIAEVTRAARWANVPLGLALVGSLVIPDQTLEWCLNSLLCGAAITGLACVRGRTRNPFGGGWMALWRRQAV
jgi:hypothetical protein